MARSLRGLPQHTSGPKCVHQIEVCVPNLFDLHFPVKKQVTISKSALDACCNAEAIVIATEWKEFKEIDWKTVYTRMDKPAFLFDGRLLLDADKLREIGFKVCSVSRSVA
jgi:UDP-N-acetyl-D-mannosaminuronate dehydrogenase